MTCFSAKSPVFTTWIEKLHKITSDFHPKRKILRPKIWSHGTDLGYPGPVFQKGPDEKFSKPQNPFIWEPKDSPVLAPSLLFEKNLNRFPTWCVNKVELKRAMFFKNFLLVDTDNLVSTFLNPIFVRTLELCLQKWKKRCTRWLEGLYPRSVQQGYTVEKHPQLCWRTILLEKKCAACTPWFSFQMEKTNAKCVPT